MVTKKRFNSKQKGSSFEREISKKLSLWLSKGERDDLFWRTQSSGGRHTIRKKKALETVNQDGDITSTHESTKLFTDLYSIEVKAYKDLNLWSLLTNIKSDSLITFWEQAERQAKSVNKTPILIAKQNNKPILFCSNGVFCKMFYHGNGLEPVMRVKLPNRVSVLDKDLCIYFLEDVLRIDPSLVLLNNKILYGEK